MPDVSTTIPIEHLGVSGHFIETALQEQREKKFTGLMRLHSPSGENLVGSFLDGVQLRLYRSNGQVMEVIPRQSWSTSMDRPGASIGFLSMPLEALRAMRIVLETPVAQVESRLYSIQELLTSAGKWMADVSPSVIHVQSETINNLYLIPSYSTSILEELDIDEKQVRYSINDVSFPNAIPPFDYDVTRYVCVQDADVWQEFGLRLAFSSLMRMLTARFGDLAGRILTERLCQQLSTMTGEKNWNINATSNGVVHHHFFETLDDAKVAYLEIVNNFNDLASPAIGPRMATGIVRDILPRLNPYHRALLQQHVYGSTVRTGGISI